MINISKFHKMLKYKRIYILWLLIILIYLIPFIVDKPNGVSEFIWLLYLIPPVLLTIHYGYKGGISAAAVGFALQIMKELYELTFYPEEYNLRNFIIVLAIALGMSFVTIGFGILLRRLEIMSRDLEFLAQHDPLTNLPNRRLFEEQLSLLIKKVEINKKKLALIFCDLDRFKYINDTMGHYTGDLVLKEVAKRFESVVDKSGPVFRLGGDEFIILLEIDSVHEAKNMADKIIFSFQTPIALDDLDFRLSASLGIAIYPDHGQDTITLMRHADMAIYQAKERGKNNYSLFSLQLEKDISQRTNLERSLKDALVKKEFVLYYQPLIDLRTEKIIGAEALVRWIHPVKGVISPSEFIPVAEETGLIVPLGEWIFHTAVKEAKKWHQNGYLLRIAINICAIQLQRNNCIKLIQKVIAEEKFDPRYLELEITESAALLNPIEMIKKLNVLRNLGIEIAIDDFGTGYSSFSYLKTYPANRIKIDRTFIQDITIEPRDKAMLEAMLVMIRSLNFTTVAEGVETAEQLAMLKELGCDLGQGYYFSRPLPAKEFMNLLAGQANMAKYEVI